ncbi:Protein BUR2 [Nakaseomyces bracarensis]|uniref:Protein BUR2 n=1 Tax=Nakaseomyces bracarensis TaxID=273131 RepID=A0ABR4NTN3_9SACH
MSEKPEAFNPRNLWPDMIRLPGNKWTFTCKEIIDKLGSDTHQSQEVKKLMEKCLMYMYFMKKNLNLFEHTYVEASILFFRYWYYHGLPRHVLDCIHISQAILVTACKTMENNRPIDAYVKATCDFIVMHKLPVAPGNARPNLDKLKWEFRDKLVSTEKMIVCQFGFDFNDGVGNPRELIEELFSGYYRYTRDRNLPEDFKNKVFPKILQEARMFIVQGMTQPVSLLCDGYKFVMLSLIYCGLEYKKLVDKEFKYPRNFFSKLLPPTFKLNIDELVEAFMDYRILEENFFDLKSNKGNKLQISKEMILAIADEDENFDHSSDDLFDYEHIKDGVVAEELLTHIEAKVLAMQEKIMNK